MHKILWLLLLASPSAFAAPPADPAALFAGHSTGEGRLKLLFQRARPFRVESHGHWQADRVFRLDQTITFEGDAPTTRFWLLHATAPGRYAFTLSDAAGPGTADAADGVLRLRYRVNRAGVHIAQVLVPAADGRTIANTGTVRWLGLPIGHLDETIRRVPEASPAAVVARPH